MESESGRTRFLKSAAALAEMAWEHQEFDIHVMYVSGHIDFSIPKEMDADIVMATLLSADPTLEVHDADE